MTDTPKIALPYIATGQAQKEVTHNEALNRLDAMIQPVVVNSITSAPPGSPTEGQAWIVAAGASGAWAGKDGQIAAWFGGWQFFAPADGWSVWDAALGRRITYDGTNWGDDKPVIQTPTLALGWIGYGGGFGSPRYSKTPDGRVTLEGLMQAGTDGTVFTLLPGYRPADSLMFGCWSGGGAYRVDVNPNGDVIVTGSNTVFSSLSGISYFAA